MNRILADPTFIHCFLEEVCEDFLFICFFKSRLTCLWRSHQTHWYTCLVICLLLIQPHYHCYHGYVENLLFFWHISSYHNSKNAKLSPQAGLIRIMLQAILAEKVNNMDQSDLFAQVHAVKWPHGVEQPNLSSITRSAIINRELIKRLDSQIFFPKRCHSI